MNSLNSMVMVFLFSVFISSVSQILLKQSAMKNYDSKIKEYLNIKVICAYGVFFLSTLITVIAYKDIPLSIGPILESSGYIFIAVLSTLILKEKMTKRKLIGMIIIVVGISIFSS